MLMRCDLRPVVPEKLSWTSNEVLLCGSYAREKEEYVWEKEAYVWEREEYVWVTEEEALFWPLPCSPLGVMISFT